MTLRRAVLVVLLSASLVPTLYAQRRARPPEQPASGPGGRDYVAGSGRAASYGEGGTAYWLFEPADPAPASAPLVVFCHGWGGVDPAVYGAWIEHLVRRGNVVVYPRYQESLRTPTAEFTPNAVAAVRDALARLRTPGHVAARLDRFAVVGHSAGGLVAANVAALAERSGLPAARAVMCVEPGRTWNRTERGSIPLEDLGGLPGATLLVAVAGDADRVARDVDARRIFAESTRVPAENKDLVTVVSDDHAKPGLEANHFAPCAKAGGGNALDFYGYWKLFDALCDAAFTGRNREYALGDTPQQRFMGQWSDGTPVRELAVVDAP